LTLSAIAFAVEVRDGDTKNAIRDLAGFDKPGCGNAVVMGDPKRRETGETSSGSMERNEPGVAIAAVRPRVWTAHHDRKASSRCEEERQLQL
jgi:hypothetical protein